MQYDDSVVSPDPGKKKSEKLNPTPEPKSLFVQKYTPQKNLSDLISAKTQLLCIFCLEKDLFFA